MSQPDAALERLVIRAAIPADADQLAPFAARAFHHAFAALSDPDDMRLYLAEAFTVERQRAEIADPNSRFFLAELDHELLGYARMRTGYIPACVTQPNPIELNRMYLDPAWKGRGIADYLMKRCIAAALQDGFATIWLGVWDRNPRARRFYARWGFVEIGSHPFQFGNDPQTDLVAVRPIA